MMNGKNNLKMILVFAFFLSGFNTTKPNWSIFATVCALATYKFYSDSKHIETKNRTNLINQESIDALKILELNNDNTVIISDIHGVEVKFSLNEVWSPLWNLPGRCHFIGKVLKYFLNNKEPFKRCIEAIALEDTTRSSIHEKETLNIINPHIEMPGMAEIYKSIDTREFVIFGCSNIGEKSYKLICEKCPNVFQYFDGCVTSDPDTGKKIKNGNEAYKKVVAKAKQLQPNVKHIVFIDNSEDKIRAALEFSKENEHIIKPIYFENPTQLRGILEEIGILE